jgi:ketosteroid isomerase-like protein
MGAAENKQVITNMFAELAKGNGAAFMDTMADDIKYTLQGRTKFSGTMNGKQEVMSKLMGPLGAALEGGIVLSPYSFIAEGDSVVMLSNGKATAKSGKSYNNSYCHVFRVIGGKVKEINEYLDTALTDEVFGK